MPRTTKKSPTKKATKKATAKAAKANVLIVATCKAREAALGSVEILLDSLSPMRGKFAGKVLYLMPKHAPGPEHTERDDAARNPRNGAEFSTHGGATIRCLRDVAFAIGGEGFAGPVPVEILAAYLAAGPYPQATVNGRRTYDVEGFSRHLNASVQRREIGCVPVGSPSPFVSAKS